VGWRARMQLDGLIFQDGWGQPCSWLSQESVASDDNEQP
jgi:hypothetical protein